MPAPAEPSAPGRKERCHDRSGPPQARGRGRRLRELDRFQRRHPAFAVPVAVVRKFGEDGGGSLAALIAYRAFFSLFPLLLLLVTVLGYMLADDPGLRAEVVDSTLAQFPVIGEQLQGRSLQGSGVALLALLGGATLASTVVSGLVGGGAAWLGPAADVAVSAALNLGIFLGAYHLLASTELPLVIGLLVWIQLAATLTVIGAELNAVLERRLWPPP